MTKQLKSIALKEVVYWSSVAIVGIVFGLGIQFSMAWTEPISSPPTDNIGAPINTGATGQMKEGGVLLNLANSGSPATFGLIVQNGMTLLKDNKGGQYYAAPPNGELIPGGSLIMNGGSVYLAGGISYGQSIPRGSLFIGDGGNVYVGEQSGNANFDSAKMIISQDGYFGGLEGAPQLAIIGKSNVAQRLNLGYDTDSDFGYISAGRSGEAWTNLILQGQGGNVGIYTTNPEKRLDVNGGIRGTELCINNDCRTSWPGGNSGGNIYKRGGGDDCGGTAFLCSSQGQLVSSIYWNEGGPGPWRVSGSDSDCDWVLCTE